MVEKEHTRSLGTGSAQKSKSTLSVVLCNSLNITGGEKLHFSQLGYGGSRQGYVLTLYPTAWEKSCVSVLGGNPNSR